MEKRKQTVVKLAQTALLAALCFVSFTFLQIKIPMPGGDATSDLYRRSTKDICVEALYWSDRRTCGTSYREN